MIVDASVLLAAVDAAHPSHERVRLWWERMLSGARRVALPWPAISEFLQISTDSNHCAQAITPSEAGSLVQAWLQANSIWVPLPTERHADVLLGLLARYPIVGSRVRSAEIAALALQHGGPVFSTDPALTLYREIEVINPLGLAAQRW